MIEAVVPISNQVTIRRNMERLELLIQSLDFFWTGTHPFRVHVVVPDDELDELSASMSSYSLMTNLQILIHSESEISPVLGSISADFGILKQMLIKLAVFDFVSSEYCIVFDSDVVACKHFNANNLIIGHRVLTEWLRPNFNGRWQESARILGYDLMAPDRNNDARMFVTPQILCKPVLLPLLKFISERLHTDWMTGLIAEYSGDHPNIWTEYTLYDLFGETTGLREQYHLTPGQAVNLRLHCIEQSIWMPEHFDRWRPARAIDGDDPGYFMVMQSITASAVDFGTVRDRWLAAARARYPDYGRASENVISYIDQDTATPEPIRLIIWDLDETLWKGTLTEGGITEHIERNYETIRNLAQRGIMSSICSKNDLEAVKTILQEKAIWDYFIFPSVDWRPKGPRLRDIINHVQLRPSSTLFIDDNPGNRAEALSMLPELVVSDESIIPGLLTDVRLNGKDDHGLTRLNQYKVLEKRQLAQIQAGGDNAEFLRSSDIQVYIEHDVVSHIDRAVELINRTNQLNFTKQRLSENLETAREQLADILNGFSVQAGLVHVKDAYGDYGFCGFFLVGNYAHGKFLHHYCFSCRTLGMGVESFVFKLLGRPVLKIAGEVLSNPIMDEPPTWIRLVESYQDQGPNPEQDYQLPGFYLRGGCDLMAVGHYANLISHETVGEYNIERDDIHLRLDHSMLARYCLDGVPAAAKVAFRSIGYSDEDFNSDILKRKPNGVWVLSFGADSWVCLYRHKATGCLIPFVNDIPGVTDPTKIPANERAKVISSPQKLSAIECLERDFEFAGLISEEQYKSNLQRVFNSMPSASVAFVMTFKDFYGPNNTKADSVVRLNRWTEEVQSQYGNVQLLPFMRFVHSNDDLLPDGHGKRMLYFRMFQYVRERASSGFRISNIREAPTMALQFNSQSSGTAETVFSPFPQSVTKLADLLEEQQQPRSE